MVFGSPLSINKTIRIYPSRLFIVLCCLLVVFMIFEVTNRSSNKYTKAGNDHNGALEVQDKLIDVLLDRKLKLNISDDESLKNSFSEFLQNMGKKIDALEGRIRELENSISQKEVEVREKKQNNVKTNSLDNPDCHIASFEGYSACPGKINWMKEKWNSDKCYAEWGVDGTECSIVKFLSEAEHWCPRLSDSHVPLLAARYNGSNLSMRSSFDGLYKQLSKKKQFEWVSLRIHRMEHKWLNASNILARKPYFQKWQKKKILVHLGLLSEENGWNIAKNAFTGGPLGELVQWSDLISSLYVLGHDISFTVTSVDVTRNCGPISCNGGHVWVCYRMFQSYLDSIKSINCPLRGTLFDLIYTDIGGLKTIKKIFKQKYHLHQCIIRVVDSFGTEPVYNVPSYANRKKMKSEWGRLDLYPKQFNTMFPHTPDNTFLGFVIETIDNNNTLSIPKKDIAVVYGKRDAFWKGKEHYLEAIQSVVRLHGTVSNDETQRFMPSYVVNHGVLPGKDLHQLLRSAKIFVGMGFPYEGPAPLEAIADGAVFLNPVFKKGTSLYDDAGKFFTKKPTTRKLTSQHPYAQHFIGPPHVRMVDLDDVEEVTRIVRDIINGPTVDGYMPHEFTCFGMLERVGFLIEEQEFCGKRKSWPPLSALQIVVTNSSSSCAEECLHRGLICEPHFFPDINQRSKFKMLNIMCDSFESPTSISEEIDYPSYKDGKCYIQGNMKLFSCAGRYTDTNRICPCRDYVKGQVALCKDCFV